MFLRVAMPITHLAAPYIILVSSNRLPFLHKGETILIVGLYQNAVHIIIGLLKDILTVKCKFFTVNSKTKAISNLSGRSLFYWS